MFVFYLVLVLFLVVGAAWTAFAIENMATSVHLTMISWQTPAIPVGLLLVVAFLIGALLLYLVSAMSARHDRQEIKQLEERIQELEQQLKKSAQNGFSAPMGMTGGPAPVSNGPAPMPGAAGPLGGPMPMGGPMILPSNSGPVPAAYQQMSPVNNGAAAYQQMSPVNNGVAPAGLLRPASNSGPVPAANATPGTPGLLRQSGMTGAPPNGGYAMPGMPGPQQQGGFLAPDPRQ